MGLVRLIIVCKVWFSLMNGWMDGWMDGCRQAGGGGKIMFWNRFCTRRKMKETMWICMYVFEIGGVSFFRKGK